MTVAEPTQSKAKSLAIAISLLGGLLLVFLSQFVRATMPQEDRLPLNLLQLVGVALFAVAIWQTGSNRPIPAQHIVRRISSYFSIQPGQLILLGLAVCFALLARLAAGDDQLARHAPVTNLSWLLAWACVLAGSYRNDWSRIGRLARWEYGLLLLLFIGALLVRGFNAGSIPPTMAGDEGSAGLSAITWIDGEANNLFSMGWFSFPSLFYAIQTVGIRLFGQTVEALRLLSALGGAITIVGLYLLARTLFDRTTAILAAAFLVTAHFHNHISRIGLQNVWDGLFAVIALGTLWHGWKKGWRGGFIICGIALGLGQYFYASFRIMPLVVTIWALSAAIVQFNLFKKRLPDLILSALTATVIYLPLALFYVSNPTEFNAPLERVTIFNGWLEAAARMGGQSEFSIILEQIRLSALGIVSAPLQSIYPVGQPMLLAGAAALFVLGLVIALLRIDLRFWLILLPILGIVITGAFSMDVPAAQRYVIVAPLASIFMALPLAESYKWLQHTWPIGRKAFAIGLAAIVLLIMYIDLDFYFNKVYAQYVLGGGNAQVAMGLIEYIHDQEEETPVVYFFGWPRMGYYSISSLPYLAPQGEGIDIDEPLTTLPEWDIDRPTTFVFLPERITELEWVQQAYPGGIQDEWVIDNQIVLFTTYKIDSESVFDQVK